MTQCAYPERVALRFWPGSSLCQAVRTQSSELTRMTASRLTFPRAQRLVLAGQRLSAWFIRPTLSPYLAGSAEGR
jgi:hypothetical protein